MSTTTQRVPKRPETITKPLPASTSEREMSPSVKGEVLIASHGGDTGTAAVHMGSLIAQRWQVPAEVISTVTPFAMYPPEVAVDPLEFEETERECLLAQLTAQVAATNNVAPIMPVHVYTGTVVDVVIDTAARQHAQLVVVGLGRRKLTDRLLGGQTPVQLLRRAPLPLLAVATGATTLPKTVVIATDFSDSSIAAARMALRVAAEDASVHLIHAPSTADGRSRKNEKNIEGESWYRVVAEGTRSLLEDLHQSLAANHPQATIRSVVKAGEPAEVISRMANDVHADLIVAGSHGRTLTQRLLLGSVAEALLRSAHVSVLVVSAHVKDIIIKA